MQIVCRFPENGQSAVKHSSTAVCRHVIAVRIKGQDWFPACKIQSALGKQRCVCGSVNSVLKSDLIALVFASTLALKCFTSCPLAARDISRYRERWLFRASVCLSMELNRALQFHSARRIFRSSRNNDVLRNQSVRIGSLSAEIPLNFTEGAQ